MKNILLTCLFLTSLIKADVFTGEKILVSVWKYI